MIYELRIYRFHKVKNAKKKFLAGFTKARRFMKKYGVTFVAAWENPDRADEFIWIRAFSNTKANTGADAVRLLGGSARPSNLLSRL